MTIMYGILGILSLGIMFFEWFYLMNTIRALRNSDGNTNTIRTCIQNIRIFTPIFLLALILTTYFTILLFSEGMDIAP